MINKRNIIYGVIILLTVVFIVFIIKLPLDEKPNCDHEWEIISGKEPSCTENVSQIKKCVKCGEEYVNVILASHSWKLQSNEFHCHEEGVKHYKCERCEEKLDVVASPLHLKLEVEAEGRDPSLYTCPICQRICKFIYRDDGQTGAVVMQSGNYLINECYFSVAFYDKENTKEILFGKDVIKIPKSIEEMEDYIEYDTGNLGAKFSNLEKITFIDPEGWKAYETVYDKNGIPLDLSDPENNVTLLLETYKDYILIKGN